MRAITILTASHIAIVAKDAKSRWKTVLSQPFNHGRASAYLHRVFPAAAIDVVYGKKFKSIFATALAFAAVMIDDFLPSLFGPKSRGMPRGFPCLIVQGCPTGRAFLFFQHLSTLLMKFHVGAPWDRKWLVAVRAVFGLARYKSHCLSKQETPSDWRHCCLGSTLVVFGGHVIEKRKAALLCVNQNESVFAGRNYFISPAFRCRNDPPVRLVAQFCNILKNHAFRQFRLQHCFAIHSHLLNRWGTQL